VAWAIATAAKKIFRWSLTSEQELSHPAAVIAIRKQLGSTIFVDAPLRSLRGDDTNVTLAFRECL